jgi:hypothetical protein
VYKPYKICPICNSPNHQSASLCNTCGASLISISPDTSQERLTPNNQNYNQLQGETDLLEGNLKWRGGTYVLGGIGVLMIVTCIATTLMVGAHILNNTDILRNTQNTEITTATLISTGNTNSLFISNTPQPTLFLATVTQGIPTGTPSPSPSIIPTQVPCSQIVQPGDDLISIIYRCGHRNFDVILNVVVELNKLQDASRIQEGQTIVVPWPTPTVDPNIVPTASPTNTDNTTLDSNLDTSVASVMGVPLSPTETLQPNVIWHTVQKDENIIMIAIESGASLRVLSELNPEIPFSQCDFGLGSGGENCTVFLYEGQQIRIPAPTPTPTIQPSASGSETPTPTATATFNAPTALSPSNRAFFGKNDLVTLRWVATGTLGTDQSYLVHIEDQTVNKTYTGTTRDLFFIIPDDWHGKENTRHDYIWTISVIYTERPDQPSYTTEVRVFTWQG